MINDILLDQNFLLLIAQGWANSQELGQLYKKLTHGGRRGLMERALSQWPGGPPFNSLWGNKFFLWFAIYSSFIISAHGRTTCYLKEGENLCVTRIQTRRMASWTYSMEEGKMLASRAILYSIFCVILSVLIWMNT